ncbi:hypothetical protein AB0E08_22040 [Streptomyces sp. NPDC048281]|uniref:hypothetical protein n=1 Tax=Streptomyces sp. NPDC048281 TaxID=3154715 RepID=UPI00341F60DE
MTVTAAEPLPTVPYDVTVAGAGAVGSAPARELTRALARHPHLDVTDRPGVFAVGGLRRPGPDVRAATREDVAAAGAVPERLVSRP